MFKGALFVDNSYNEVKKLSSKKYKKYKKFCRKAVQLMLGFDWVPL